MSCRAVYCFCCAEQCKCCVHAVGCHLTLRAGTRPSNSSRKMMEGAHAAACRTNIHTGPMVSAQQQMCRPSAMETLNSPELAATCEVLSGKARLCSCREFLLSTAKACTGRQKGRPAFSPSQTACAGAAQHLLHTCPGSLCPCVQTGQQAWAQGRCRCCSCRRCCCCLAQLAVLHTQQPTRAQGQSCPLLVVHGARCPCSTAAASQQRVHTCCSPPPPLFWCLFTGGTSFKGVGWWRALSTSQAQTVV
jgi:hypothetical protein